MINYECCDGLNMGLLFFFLMNMVVTGFDGKKKKVNGQTSSYVKSFLGKKKLWGMIDNEGKETQMQKET